MSKKQTHLNKIVDEWLRKFCLQIVDDGIITNIPTMRNATRSLPLGHRFVPAAKVHLPSTKRKFLAHFKQEASSGPEHSSQFGAHLDGGKQQQKIIKRFLKIFKYYVMIYLFDETM